MSGQDYVSKGKWISVGVSAGGFATVALTAQAPPGLAAAIAFAPGRGSSGPDTVCGESSLVAAFAQYGKTSRVPLLWVSAENDHFFGPRLTAQFDRRVLECRAAMSILSSGLHSATTAIRCSAPRGLPIWSPIVDRFLAVEQSGAARSADRPADAGCGAAIEPQRRGRETFKTYLESGPNKAFVISGSHFGWATGRRTTDEAVKDALGFCKPDPGGKCTVVNVNNKPAE